MAVYGIPLFAGLTLMSVLSGSQQNDEVRSSERPYGVRAPTPAVAALVEDGRRRSSTFRALLDDLAGSDWIVFVQSGSCLLPGVRGCLLHKVGTFHGVPYLRVVLVETSSLNDDAIVTIGHELQHAVEAVRAPRIAASKDIRQLYRRIGYISKRTRSGEVYETRRAVTIETDIRRELESPRRATARARPASP